MRLSQLPYVRGYDVQEQVGRGDLGEVYRAYQHLGDITREVAVKVILPGRANHPDFVRRFDLEAQIVACLEHPHIVPLYDYWREPDGAYLIRRWLPLNLSQHLQSSTLDLPYLMRLLDHVGAALSYAHHYGVTHSRIKPGNILLDEESHFYLTDFGIANYPLVSFEETAEDGFADDVRYISPEKARGESVTPQTDIYSLGVVLYEALTGTHPFEGLMPQEMIRHHIDKPIPSLTERRPDLPAALNDVLQKATCKDMSQRYGKVSDFLSAVRDASGINTSANLVEQLTLRENEILYLIVEGRSNREIAQDLHITLATVKWHVNQLYKKLRVHNRVQAIVCARELNLIVPDDTATTVHPSPVIIDTPTQEVDAAPPKNPYKGLHAFQAVDARDFFGREKLIGKLTQRLAEKETFSRFLAVIGPSGSGKSSLVRAGLIPALMRGEVPGSEGWYIVDMIPGHRPLDELEVALTKVTAHPTTNIREHLTRDEHGLVRVAGLILPDNDCELLVVIDQFEEVFTLVEDETVRSQFLDLIKAAVTASRSRVRVVVTLRADFYDRPLLYPEFGELVQERTETVLPLTADELEQAIVKPAERAGVTYEEGLPATIINDTIRQPGALPLLQYALTELFQLHHDGLLTHASYRATGGTVGALAQRANELYDEFDADGQEIIRQMFLRLVTLGEGTEDARRRIPQAELMALANGNEDTVDDIIRAFTEYRLLSMDHDPGTRQPTVEVAHEALLREWRRLREWLIDSRDDIQQQRKLAVATMEWQSASRNPDFLLRGSRLAQFDDWSNYASIALTENEIAYLLASRGDQERRITLRRRVRNTTFAVVIVIAVIMSFLAVDASNARDKAEQEQLRAENALLVAEHEAAVNHSLVLVGNAEEAYENGLTDLALALILEALNIDDPPPEAQNVFSQIAQGIGSRAVVQGHSYPVTSVAISLDPTNNGYQALTSSCAEVDASEICQRGEVILWNLPQLTEVRRFDGHTDWVNSVALSSDGQMALTGSSDGTVVLWNVRTGELIRRLEGHIGGVNVVAFLPDSARVLSGGDDGILVFWDTQTGDIIHRFRSQNDPRHEGAITALAISPDGLKILSGSAGGRIILWDADESSPTFGAVLQIMDGHTTTVTGVAFMPGADGIPNAAMSAGWEFTLRLWDLDTGEQTRHTAVSNSSSFLIPAPDFRTALFSHGSRFQIWDVGTWQYRSQARQSDIDSTVRSLAVSSDGKLMISGYEDGHQVVWNRDTSHETWQLPFSDPVSHFDLSSDGTLMATVLFDGSTLLWDLEQGKTIQRITTGVGPGFGAFSPDGKAVLIGVGDAYGGTTARSVSLWDTGSGNKLFDLGRHAYWPRSIAFSPDGRTALVGTQTWLPSAWPEAGLGDLILWDLETGQPIRRFEIDTDVTGIDFNTDGTLAVTSGSAPTGHAAILWDVSSGLPIQFFDYSDAYDVEFIPGDTTILVATGDGSLILWDIQSGDIIRHYLGHSSKVWTLDISPDGQLIASGDADGVILVRDFETGQVIRRFTDHTASIFNLTFSPDGQSVYSSGLGGTVRQWEVADRPIAELLSWVQDNRYIREFTCEERAKYRIEPLCE